MQKKKVKELKILLIFCSLFVTAHPKADETSIHDLLTERTQGLEDISKIYGQSINLASGYKQLIKNTPSSVEVITSDDIKKIGAVTIEEVLSTISGIHLSYRNGTIPAYNIRGLVSSFNGSVLVFLDGIPLKSSAISSSFFSLSHLAKNIDKIEIIKGPASAIYGADAFSGVINIITKKTLGSEAGVIIGSYSDFGGWLNHGFRSNDLNVNFSAQGLTTKGSNRIIESDRQSLIDSQFETSSSLAPGPINRGKEEVNVKLYLEYKNTEIHTSFLHKNIQNGRGNAKALDNDGYINNNAWLIGLKHKFNINGWDNLLTFNYSNYTTEIKSNLFPKGALNRLFVEPVKNDIKYTSNSFSSKLSSIYRDIDSHIIHSGIGFQFDSINNISDKRNYKEAGSFALIPLDSIQLTENIGTKPFVGNESRYNVFGFIQDEWTISNDLILTAGFRVDYFTDFGFSVNPRTSLVWNPSLSLTTKLMYGFAFRAPSFTELNTNKSVLISGNKDLKPESIQMIEWSIHKNWLYNLDTKLNLFWYETKNLITDPSVINQLNESESRKFFNTEGSHSYGLEVDVFYQPINNLEFNINYSYLKVLPKNINNDAFIVSSPSHQVYASINWDFLPDWSINIRSTSVIGRIRPSSDKRESIKDYTKLDFTLIKQNVLEKFDFTLKINNFLNADVRDPSIDGVSIPGDLPLADRSFMGIISIKF